MKFDSIEFNEAIRQLLSGEARIDFSTTGAHFVNKDGDFIIEEKPPYVKTDAIRLALYEYILS